MKPRLQASLGQQLVLTPQLRQALHLLQLSALELEAEIAEAVESNPLLEWAEPEPAKAAAETAEAPVERERADADVEHSGGDEAPEWEPADDGWADRVGTSPGSGGSDEDGDGSERVVQEHTLQTHLAWQLHLAPLGDRDRRIGETLVDAIDDDGYMREPLAAIAEALLPDITCSEADILVVLRLVQGFDPPGIAARNLGECLALQLRALPPGTPGRDCALAIADGPIERLPKIGIDGMALALACPRDDVALALQLLRTLDPRPGGQVGAVSSDTYITPDCVITRQQGMWRVSLATSHQPRLTINRGYEQMIRHAGASDAGYLRGRLQEARWMLKNLEARGDTLLKVVRCLVSEQSGFLEFGAQALRPLTLREVAGQVGVHESTVSRAIARKYVRTPRGTVPLRSFFASGIDTEGGGEASSIAIQTMIKRLIDAENPRKPLSDARLAETLKASGVPVARRTVAKYREAMGIESSHERVSVG